MYSMDYLVYVSCLRFRSHSALALCGKGVSTIQLRDGTEGEFIEKLESFVA